jgi:phthalate 4,5-dioxygenase oxygenase subunit
MTAEENDLLCRIEGDAPMGQIMRRHWIPACLAEEVGVPDGAPVRVKLLGEELVVFRDTAGKLGILGEHCPHRGVSLAFGRNEECGLRCLYHGWKMDVEGNVLEQPSEHGDRRRPLKHKAYPARESGGFVWTYMGPADAMPEFERPAFAPTDEVRVSIVKITVACNWAQIVEGQIDSAHSSTLHASDMVPAEIDGAQATDSHWLRPSTDRAPQLQSERTSYGFRYAAIRRPIKNPDTQNYVRMTVYIAPFTCLIPPNNLYNVAAVIVPTDDTHSMFYFIAWGAQRTTPDNAAWRAFNCAQVGVDLDAQYRPVRTLDNMFRQDRAAMKRGDATGIRGIPNQDIAMWETMGPITDRTTDLLATSDLAVAQFRRIMVDAARQMHAGEPAIGTVAPRVPHASLRSFEGVVPKTTDWRTLGTPELERSSVSES